MCCSKGDLLEGSKLGCYKCNSDGASKGNLGPSAGGFCIRNWNGEFIYAEYHNLGVKTSLEAEATVMDKGLQYCLDQQLTPVILETDSLILENILDGIWEVPWCISLLIKKIKWMMKNGNVEVKHVMREGNKVADFLTNIIFFFAGTEVKIFHSFQEIPREGKALITLDAQQVPNIRITKVQNTYFVQ